MPIFPTCNHLTPCPTISLKFQQIDCTTSEHCAESAIQSNKKILCFHTFPSTEEVTVSPHTRVCSRHFKKEDVRQRTTNSKEGSGSNVSTTVTSHISLCQCVLYCVSQ
uniref:THAP-type domain-containing protein n=1 Tax=Denticeps clupeoides TaxID=299321 RepID=A0AAY4DXY9_9TELE